MTLSLDQPQLNLSDCGCCAGIAVETPVVINNRPGLAAIAYRIGTHAHFKASLLARRSESGLPELRKLKSRDDDDFTIALLDAWALTSDVLTFYQERIANESYMRTATERGSIINLARLIGYELRPGVAASTYLAFTLETGTGAPASVTIDKRAKVQSIPGSGEKPQTFETIEKVEARGEWNDLKPQLLEAQKMTRGVTQLYLEGTNTQLQPGDAILIVGDEREKFTGDEHWDFRILQTVTSYREQGYTLVTWAKGLGWRKDQNKFVDPAAKNVTIFAFRQRAALFGHNAPDWRTMHESVKKAYKSGFDPNNPGTQWPDFQIKVSTNNEIDLDVTYPRIAIGSWIVLDKPGYTELYKVSSVATSSRTDFTLTAKTTRVGLDAKEHLSWFGLRDTVVFAQTEKLELAESGVASPIGGNTIELDHLVTPLEPMRPIIVSGKRRQRVVVNAAALDFFSDDGSPPSQLKKEDVLEVIDPPVTEPDGTVRWRLLDKNGKAGFVKTKPDNIVLQSASDEDETSSELAFIKEMSPSADQTQTMLVLKEPLRKTYSPPTVKIFANVALATHGETVADEVLGSGDAGQSYQRFALRQSPLTYTSADKPSGGESTLEVRVNDLKWTEVPTLFGYGPRERIYVTHIDDDKTTTVQFGDGITGARLPIGYENVKATYRKGIGLGGLMAAGQLSLLMTRPLGVKSVINPIAASGAQDPQTLDDARSNSPLTVLTLDRIVSLRDYEDFARSFSGIAKALATWTWNIHTRGVFITVAGINGTAVADDAPLHGNLVSAILQSGDSYVPITIKSYRGVTFKLIADVKIDPQYIEAKVLAAIEAALRTGFSFAARGFGQPVTLSEVFSVIQNVAGVVAVDINKLHRTDAAEALNSFLSAFAPRAGDDAGVLPAELLTLDAAPLELGVMP